MIIKDYLEQLCVDWFHEGGYEYAYGPDIAHKGNLSGREDCRQIVLNGYLLTALRRINPYIPVSALEHQIIHVLAKSEPPVLIQHNRKFQYDLQEDM